jgi:hypothetical protein
LVQLLVPAGLIKTMPVGATLSEREHSWLALRSARWARVACGFGSAADLVSHHRAR